MAVIKKNVVTRLYVVHCSLNGIAHDEYVQAESEDVANSIALRRMSREFEGIGNHKILWTEYIDPVEEGL